MAPAQAFTDIGSTIVPVDDMISGLTDTQMQVRVHWKDSFLPDQILST